MKNIALTSIAVLAIAACSDTPETKLDEAHTGGGEKAVELVEGTPEVTEPTTEVDAEAVPESMDAVDPGSIADVDPSELLETPVETAAPEVDGVLEESGLTTVESVTEDAVETAVEDAVTETIDTDAMIESVEGTVEEAVDAADTEEMVDGVVEMVEEKAEEVVEETTDTETPQ